MCVPTDRGLISSHRPHAHQTAEQPAHQHIAPVMLVVRDAGQHNVDSTHSDQQLEHNTQQDTKYHLEALVEVHL